MYDVQFCVNCVCCGVRLLGIGLFSFHVKCTQTSHSCTCISLCACVCVCVCVYLWGFNEGLGDAGFKVCEQINEHLQLPQQISLVSYSSRDRPHIHVNVVV